MTPTPSRATGAAEREPRVRRAGLLRELIADLLCALASSGHKGGVGVLDRSGAPDGFEQAVRFCDQHEAEQGKGIVDAGDHACSACGAHDAHHVYAPIDEAAIQRGIRALAEWPWRTGSLTLSERMLVEAVLYAAAEPDTQEKPDGTA